MLSYVFFLLLFPCAFSFLLLRYKKSSNYNYVAFHIYISNIVMNLGCFFNYGKSILNILDFSMEFTLIYSIGSIASCFLTYECFCWLCRHHEITTYKKTTYLLGLFTSLLFVYFLWLLGESGRQSFELFIYNLVTPVNSEVANFDLTLSAMIVFMIIQCSCLTLCFRQNLFHVKAISHKDSKKERFQALFYPIILLVLCLSFPLYSFHLEDAYAYFFIDNSYIEDHYVDPKTTQITWPEKKQNLVYIFLESFEASSFPKEYGGLEDSNILPNLLERMSLGTTFSSQEEGKYGGARGMYQAGVTIQGINAALGGVNYKIPIEYSSDKQYAVIPHLTNLSDLLYEQGYQSYFMIGTTVDDYQIGPYFRAHGNTITKGLQEKIQEGKLPQDYKVWWGFEDKKLYEFAQEDLTQLASEDTPFFYTIATNDTHRTSGYTDEMCPTNYEQPKQNSIACADLMLSNFIDWIMAQPFYENTTVVIVGDHLGHEEAYTKTLVPQEDRRIFNLILNSQSPYGQTSQYHRDFWAADMFPTVVSAMGAHIEGERLGLGTNLFSKQPTQMETFGVDYVSQQLSENSFFYTDEFLQP